MLSIHFINNVVIISVILLLFLTSGQIHTYEIRTKISEIDKNLVAIRQNMNT